MVIVFTQVNDPVCQPNQQTTADNITDRNRNQVISDEVHHGQVRKIFRCRTDRGPEFRRCEVADYNTHRDHKHVCDTVLKTAGNKHRDRQHHNERFVHQAAARITHPYCQTYHQVCQDTKTDGLNKSMVHFVVGGL